MPDNEKVVIDVELELQKARSDLASQREDFGNVKNDIQSIKQDTQNSGALGLAGAMDEEQARVTTVIDSLTSKMEHMSHLGSNVSEAMLNSLRNGIKDLSAQRDLLKDGGSFSVNIAHQMFGDMSKEIQNELARQTPAIANAVRGMFNSGMLTGNIQQMAATTFSNLFISNLNQSIKQMSGGEGVLQKYIASMMPYVIGTGNTQAFQRMRYSGQDLVRSSMSVRSLIPEQFRDSYLKGSFTSNIRHGNNNMLASGGVLALRNQLESNAIANAIAERTGQMKLDNAGYGQLQSSITTAEYNRFAREQYNDLVTRATGHGGAKIDFYGTNLSPRDTNRLIGRMLGGTTGESLKALEEIARIGGIKENWQPTAANLSQSLRLSRMPQRHLEQYEIKKFALGDILNNDLTRARTVMLNQSVATNELGLRGKNNQSTDMIIEIDASKFDKNDPAMAKRVTDLYRNGYTINGRHYEAVATHGTGEDAVIRMIDANAKRQISKRYADFAKQYGLKGDFWNLFAENGRAWSLSDLSRMYDAQNKMWTGAADVTNEAAFRNANFAFLDLTKLSKESKQKFADGIGWITKSLFPYSGMQSRFAQAGKGVLQSIDTNNIGAWAEAMSGPEGKKGKFYQELLKATGLDSLDNIQGLIEETQIKNMFAYKGMSTDQRNRALTALMRTFRPTLMHSTEDATTYADALGAQAMQFINWNATSDSRAFSREHTQALIERIRMLNTPTGRREMLEHNAGMFGEKYRAGAIDENDPAAYALANNEIRRLMQATASGAFVDLTGKSIQNLQLNRTLHQAVYGRYGHSSAEEIRKDLLANSMISTDPKLVDYVNKQSEDQLRGIFALDQGSAVNFGNMKADEFTGVVSPGGIGEVVRLKNYAAIAAPIYKALGYSTEGLLLHDKDMETLSGRDWDGDKLKAVYGRLGELYWDQVSNLKKRISEQNIPDIEKTPTRRGSKFYDTPEEQMEFLARSIAVSRLMGVGDSGAAKAASDLDDVNSLIAAEQFRIFYQYATDSLKNGETPEMNDKMKTINFRPRDFRRLTKIYPGLTDVSGVSDDSDIYNDTQSGFKINLESLRRQNLHRVDVRSAKRAGTVEAASLAAAFAAAGLDYGSADAVLRAQEHLYETEEKDIIPEELVQARKLRSAMNKIKVYDAAGQHGALSMRDEAFITEMQQDAQANITAYAQKHLNDKPLFDNEGNQITEVNKYINRLQKQFSVDVAQNLLHGNGLRAETLRSLGYTEETAPYMFASLFSPNTTVDMTQKQIEDVRKVLEQAKREAVVSEFNRQTRSGQGRDAMIARGRGVTSIEPWMVAEDGTALTLSGLTVTDASGNVVKDDYIAELRTNAERRAAREAEEIRRQNNPNVPQTAAEARGSFAHKALELYYGNDQKYAGKSAAQIMLDLFGEDDSSVKVLKDAGITLENGTFKGDSREVGVLNNYLKTLGLITTKFNKGQGSYVPEFSAEYSGKDFQDAIAALNLNPKDNKNKTWIKTDLLRYNKNGTIDVFDYKPDLRQAGESLFQTISYIGMIDKIAEEAYKNGDANTLAKFGKFGTFENGQYKSNFNKLYGIDLSSGQSVEMDTHGREEDLRNVYKRFLAGASNKAEAANMGFEPGLEIYRQKLLSEMQANDRAALDIEATDKLAAQILKDNRESGKQIELNPVMATKFQQDQEALRSISSALFKKEMRLTNQPEAVYSEYGGMQRQLDKMLPQNTISILKAQARQNKDEISEEYYDTLQRERRQAEADIDRLSIIDANSGFEDTRERVSAIINGTQRNAAASKIFALHNAVRQKESDLEFIRSKNFKEDKWTSEDAEKAYKTGEEALRAIKATESAGIKRILEEDKTNDDNTLSRLTKDFTANDPYTKIEEQFKQREQNIADFIEQKKRDVETFTKDMKQAESAGNKDEANQYKKRISEQTQAQQAAEDYLKSGDLNRQKEIDRQRAKFQQEMNGERAVLQSENAAISAGRWRYQNMQVGATAWERNIVNSRMRAEEAGQQYKQYEIQYKYALQRQTEAERTYNQNTTIENQEAFARASKEVENYKKAMEEAAAAQQAFGAGGGVVKGTLDTIAGGFTRITAQFGRRLFRRAQQEARQFAVQFSTQMSTIQSITMKSDEEMTDVRRNTIEKAKSLHTSIANVADVEASLYRQGQSDAEVSERTDAIVKFATVTGVKVTAATKYLTSAIQNGLVGSVQEAMDVLVALGDSAATTAEEISKGMQKSAAAAKNAGVSYEELTSMLTIITSKTQLGGATAGTAQQTIFSRMTRVTNSGSVTDSSGQTTTINDVEKALQGAGINLRNPENPREIRNVFQVLRDLSKVWNELDDLRKGNISYYMAGGRQVNMFQTLMEGMAENGGKDQDEYLGLAEGSKGVTQSKYEIAIDNIQTKLTDLKTTFDSVIESVVSGGVVGGVLDFTHNILNGIDSVSDKIGGIPTLLTILGTAILAFATKAAIAGATASAAWTPFLPILALLGAASVLGIGAAVAATAGANNETNRRNEIKNRVQQHDSQTEKYESQQSTLSEAQKQLKSFGQNGELSDENVERMKKTLSGFGDVFPGLAEQIQAAGNDLAKWNDILSEAINLVTQMKDVSKQNSSYEMFDIIYSDTAKMYENFRNMSIASSSKGWTTSLPNGFALNPMFDRQHYNVWTNTYENKGQVTFSDLTKNDLRRIIAPQSNIFVDRIDPLDSAYGDNIPMLREDLQRYLRSNGIVEGENVPDDLLDNYMSIIKASTSPQLVNTENPFAGQLEENSDLYNELQRKGFSDIQIKTYAKERGNDLVQEIAQKQFELGSSAEEASWAIIDTVFADAIDAINKKPNKLIANAKTSLVDVYNSLPAEFSNITYIPTGATSFGEIPANGFSRDAAIERIKLQKAYDYIDRSAVPAETGNQKKVSFGGKTYIYNNVLDLYKLIDANSVRSLANSPMLEQPTNDEDWNNYLLNNSTTISTRDDTLGISAWNQFIDTEFESGGNFYKYGQWLGLDESVLGFIKKRMNEFKNNNLLDMSEEDLSSWIETFYTAINNIALEYFSDPKEFVAQYFDEEDVQKYNEQHSAQSQFDAVVTSLTPQNYGWRNEYQQLRDYASKSQEQTIKDVNALIGAEEQFPNYAEFLQKDTTLAVQMDDVTNGLKTWDDFMTYLDEKVFGLNLNESVRKFAVQAKSFGQKRGLLSKSAAGTLTTTDMQVIADELGVDVSDVYADKYGYYIGEYDKLIAEAEKQSANSAASIVQGLMQPYINTLTDEDKTSLSYTQQLSGFLSSISNVENRQNVANQLYRFNSLGYQFSFNDGVVSGAYKAAPIQPTRHTRDQLRQFALSPFGVDSFDVVSALEEASPKFKEWNAMTQPERNSLYGQTLYHTIQTDFVVEGQKDLEDAGRIIDGIANSVETIRNGNVLESFKASAELMSGFKDFAELYNTIIKLINTGRGTEEEWNVLSLQGFDPEAFTSGRLNLQDYESSFNKMVDLQEESFNKSALAIINSRLGFNFSSISKARDAYRHLEGNAVSYGDIIDQFDKEAEQSGYAWNAAKGVYEYRGIDESNWYEDWKNNRERIVNKDVRNRNAATVLYNALESVADNQNAFAFLDTLSKLREENPDVDAYLKEQLTNNEIDQYYTTGDLKRFFHERSNANKYSEFDYGTQYAEAAPYLQNLINGNVSEVPEGVLEFFQKYGFDYKQYAGKQNLTAQDIANIEIADAIMRAKEIEQANVSMNGLSSNVERFLSATSYLQRRDVFSELFGNDMQKYANAINNLDKTPIVAQYLNRNEEDIFSMPDEERMAAIEKEAEDWKFALGNMIEFMGENSLFAESMSAWFDQNGYDIKEWSKNGNFKRTGGYDFFAVLDKNRRDKQEAQLVQRVIANFARNANNVQEFRDEINALRYDENGQVSNFWKNLEEVSPTLSEEVQAAQTGKDWNRARQVLMNIDQEFTTKGLEDLEKAGKVMEGIANTYRQMQEGNPLTQFRAQQGYEGEWLQFLEAQVAANKVFNGTADEADWQTFASFYHISGIERYQRGQLNVNSQRDRVSSVNGWYANEQPNNLYQGLLEQEFISRMRANNYPGYDKFTDDQLLNMMRNNPELVTDEMQTYVGEEMRALGFGQGEDGRWKFNGTAIGEMDWEQYKTLRETLPDYTKQNQATARSLYQQLLAGNYGSVEAFGKAISSSQDENVQRYWKELQNANVDLTNMTTDELLDYLINEGYGTNLNRTTLADVDKYIEALRSGNVDVLGQLENDRFAQAFLNNNISGWSDMYSRVLSGKTLTANDLLSLNQSVLRTRLRDWEASNRNYQGLSDEIFTAMYGNTSEQRSLRQQYASRVNTISERARMLERGDWTGLQQSYGWNDQELAYYKKNQGLLRKEMEKESNETGERMRGFVGKALDVDLDQFASFDQLDEFITEEGSSAQNAMITWLEQFFSSIGLSLKDFVDKNKLDADSTFNIFEEASDKYAETKKANEARDFIAEAAERAGTFEDFRAAIEASGTEYESEFKQLIAGADEATQRAFAGESDWATEGRERMMRIGETMSAVMRDTEAERMMQQFDKAFAEQGGFTAQANGELKGVNLYDVLQNNQGLRDYLSSFEEGTNLLQSFDEQTDLTAEDQKRLAQVMNNQAVKSMRLYGDRTDDVISLMDALRKGGQSAQSALKGINQQMTQIGQNRYYMDKWRGGDRSTETSEAIAAMTGFNAKDLREGKVLDSILEQSFKAQDASDLEVVQTWADTLMTSVNQYFADNKIDVKGPDINLEAGEMDASALQAALDAAGALTQETAAQLMAILEAFGVEGELQEIRDDKGGVQFRFKVKGFSGGSFNKGGGGGGGGGGKSAAQELIDRLKKEQATFDHQIKMIQSQENKYEGAGEFLNLNVMLGLENEAQLNLIDNLEQSIEKLKEQLAQTKEGSDDWYALRDAIMSYEEAIEGANRAIENNTRKQDENLKKARQTTQTLEQALKGQIEEQKQIDRDMLGGTVSLQQQILDVIKQRYQEEWDQVDKDLQKKREALQEEINMIDERLRRRTEAEDDAEKREELAEMRRQAALIAADPTRSKDYNELMKKIREGEQEESRKTAERNAEYQKRMLEQESESLDKASQEGAERLENFLKDANNMAIEINSILEGSYEDAMKWFMANSEEYKNGLDAMQKQFINNVEDTWKQMNHIIDTYWPEINEIIAGGRDAYIERMKETDQYRFGSETDREQLVTEWGEQWDNWINAWKTGATYSHDDEWSKTLYDSVKSISGDSPAVKKALEDTSADVKAILNKMPKDVTPAELDQLYAEYDAQWNEFGGSDKRVGELYVFINAVRDYQEALLRQKDDYTKVMEEYTNTIYGSEDDETVEILREWERLHMTGYDEGGLVDFTGPAMVHGSPLRPESFLDAEDTALMRAMLDSMSRVRVHTLASFIDPAKFGGNTQTIGDVNITITEAKFEDDADIEAVAARVGEAFVQQLNQQGFTTGKFAL